MKVFICHSSLDHGFVHALAKKIQDNHVDIWIDDWNIQVGDSITGKINSGLEASSFFVPVLSRNSLRSEWVSRELNSTLMRQMTQKNVKILPVWLDIEASEVPPLIVDIFAAKFSNSQIDEREVSKLLEPILNTIKADRLGAFQDSYLENIINIIDPALLSPKPTRKQVEVVLSLFKDPVYRNYFFKTVNNPVWFPVLVEHKVFSAENAPSPKETGDKGYYSFPHWNVLSYLESVAKQLHAMPEAERKTYERELIRIIKQVSAERKKAINERPDDFKLDNYGTWNSFAQILQNIPESYIDEEMIGYFDAWLTSEFNTLLPSSEIGSKLLPRIISAGDYSKAEQISKILLGYRLVEPSKEATLFEGERKIVSRVEKYWLADIFLKRKTAFSLGKHCSPEFIFWLAAEVRKILSGRYAKRLDFAGSDGRLYALILKMEDINSFSGYSVSARQPLGPEEQDVFRRDSLKSIADISEKVSCPVYEAFETYILGIIHRHLGADFKIERKAIEEFYESLTVDHSNVWIETLYDDFQDGYEDALSVYVFILKDFLAGKLEEDPEKGRAILRELWGNGYRYPVFKRLVLYCLGEYFDSCHEDFFSHYFGSDLDLLNEPYLTPEVFKLFELNAEKLTQEEQAKVEATISRGPKRGDAVAYTDMQIKFWQQQWYTSLKSIPKYAKHAESLQAETKHDVSIPRRVTTWIGPGDSPLSKEELLTKSNKEIAEYIPAFAAQKRDFFARITGEGLAETLGAVVKEKPEKFIQDMSPFINSPYRYVYSILDGILEAYKNANTNLDWGNILAFIKSYVARDGFWEDKLLSGDSELRRANHEWIVGKVAEIIKYATYDDATAIEAKFNSEMQEILFVFIKHLSREYADENKDPVFHSLNSIEGKTAEALLNLSLRCARFNQKEGKTPIWNADLKGAYEKLLNDKIYDAYTVLGEHLPNFNYLDKLWAEVKVEEFERLEDKAWFTFIVGYLYSPKVYDDLYAMMRQHYVRALSYDFGTSRAQELLSQHIAVGYLRSQDNLGGDGLINQFLETAKPEAIERFIGFIWMQRVKRDEVRLGETPEQAESKKRWVQVITPRIIALWAYVYENYQKTQKWGKGFKKVNSELVNLSVFLPELDEVNLKWILFAVPCLEAFMGATFLIEYLNCLKDNGDLKANAKYLADIWNEMLKKFAPDYDIENVQAILSFIKKHQPELAKPIYDRYVELGREDIVKNL